MLGVCYYPEHWPETTWADDARRMREMGIAVVRIGEFAWSRLEPEPGRLELDWLRRAMDTLHAAGLKIVLGTPTATPPKWLMDRHPEIAPIGPDGRVRGFGSRRHYTFSSQIYRASHRPSRRGAAAPPRAADLRVQLRRARVGTSRWRRAPAGSPSVEARGTRTLVMGSGVGAEGICRPIVAPGQLLNAPI